jgi:diphthamide synthase (EF-2-diphthine--ammonia ligase)
MLQQSGEYHIAGLLTTVNSEFDRVAMHGTRTAILRAQADAAGLPLWDIPLPWPCSNQHYESAMSVAINRARRENIEAIAFGDLFLADIRAYREQQLRDTGIKPLFPIWTTEADTRTLAESMIASGLKAKIACLDPRVLNPCFAGREFDHQLLSELPDTVDPCGERGEFHTIVYAGPMFSRPISLITGETVERDGFLYTDFIP